MASTITQAALNAEYGSYYKNGGQGAKDLKTQFYAKNGTSAIFTRRLTEDTRIELSNVTQGAVVQGWQKAFTPYGDTTFIPKIIDLYKMKVDLSYTPDDLEQSWLGFLADSGLSRKDWPLIRWMMETLIMPKIQEDYELNGIFHGVKGSVTPGTAQAIGAAMNGIKSIINAGIDGTTITPFSGLGTVPTDAVDVCEYVEEFATSIDEVVRPYIKTINMSTENARLYTQGKRQKYNMYHAQENSLTTLADFPGLSVAGFLSHTGSNKMWSTPVGNAIEGIKKLGNDKLVKIEEALRVVNVMTDFYRGIGFEQDRYVYTNSVELPE